MRHWDEKFFRSTRGRIVTLLCHGSRPVDELARELGLTTNGVRAHLAILERDGIVRQGNTVRRVEGWRTSPKRVSFRNPSLAPSVHHFSCTLGQVFQRCVSACKRSVRS